jgi:apolipoprotein N-acyltransferase
MPPKIHNTFSRFRFAGPLCFGAGAFGALAMAPANFWPALFVSFPILYLTLHLTKDKKRAFALGWLFGFGYFAFSLSWIGNALLVDGNPYKWAWILAVTGLPAILALFPACATLATRLRPLNSISGFFAFVLLMGASEWLRGNIFTGFPWNLYGYSWADILEIVQITSLVSTYILTLLTIFWASTPVFWALNAPKKAAIITVLSIASFTACFAYGHHRLTHTEIVYHEGVQARLIQPNINQADKWDSRKVAAHFSTLLELSRADNSGTAPPPKTTYIIWPETAINNWFTRDKGSINAMRSMLHSYDKGAALFTGALRYNAADKSYANSLMMVDQEGIISNIYNKHHLVPFGEYIPYQKWIPLKPVVQFTGFQKGDGLTAFETPEGLKYSPLICYEIIFPGKSIAEGTTPDFIINVTNDAWYGKSAGPHQHFIKALFRAVETGIPVFRVANTGFTGMIDPLGRAHNKTQLFEENAQNVQIPKKITRTPLF